MDGTADNTLNSGGNTGAAATVRPPASFWVVTLLGLLWNSFGAYLYTMANLKDPGVMAGAPPEMLEYVNTMPLWAHAMWALGIWGSLAGSLLMLLRSRHAVPAFLVSFLGAVGSFMAQARAGVLEPAQPIFILAVIAFLLWYSRRAATLGKLR